MAVWHILRSHNGRKTTHNTLNSAQLSHLLKFHDRQSINQKQKKKNQNSVAQRDCIVVKCSLSHLSHVYNQLINGKRVTFEGCFHSIPFLLAYTLFCLLNKPVKFAIPDPWNYQRSAIAGMT